MKWNYVFRQAYILDHSSEEGPSEYDPNTIKSNMINSYLNVDYSSRRNWVRAISSDIRHQSFFNDMPASKTTMR